MVRALPFILVLITAVLALTACAGPTRTSWQPSEALEGTVLHIGVAVGGCDSFDSLVASETDQDVQIKAYIDKDAHSECDSNIRMEQHDVQLRAPLGDRPVSGCNPDDAAYTLQTIANDRCREAPVRSAHD